MAALGEQTAVMSLRVLTWICVCYLTGPLSFIGRRAQAVRCMVRGGHQGAQPQQAQDQLATQHQHSLAYIYRTTAHMNDGSWKCAAI